MIDPQNLAPSPAPETTLVTESSSAGSLASIPTPSPRPDLPGWLATILLALILAAGGYFRFLGLNWDSDQHLHPDERFMTNVASAIRPVSIFQYFDTEKSTLNPFPYGSFTYGMFPLFLTRYVAELVNKTDYKDIVLVGRVLSALFDLAAVALLFFLGARLYNRRIGLLAAALSAAAVLPIQLSHYFAVDSFATVFIVAAFYVAVPTMDGGKRWHYAIFGLLTGLAMACKINTAPLAGVIIVAGIVRLVKAWRTAANRREILKEVVIGWFIAGLLTALSFRVFQPYAFNGPTIFGIGLNQRWLDIMREVTDQVAGRSEWPPNHHWTNRPQLTYAWIQLAAWAVGLPLGLAATVGWAWAAWRTWRGASLERGEWQSHILSVVWVGAYFAWQNGQFWRYMRYFMPIYPFAILLAAWAMIELYDRVKAGTRKLRRPRLAALLRILALLVLAAVTTATYAYAYAFTRIYARPHTRVAASHWILNGILGPLNLEIQTQQSTQQQPIAVPYDLVLRSGEAWRTGFKPVVSGAVSEITSFRLYAPDTHFDIKITKDPEGKDVITNGTLTQLALPVGTTQPATIFLLTTTLAKGQTYYLRYTVRSGGALTATDLILSGDVDAALPLNSDLVDLPDGATGQLTFTADNDITIDRLNIESVEITYPSESSTVKLVLSRDDAGNNKLAESEATVNLIEAASLRTFSFSPVSLESNNTYFISVEVISGAPITIAGTTLANETSWDDALPLRVDSYDPLGGIYVPVNLELFEPDNEAKRARIVDVLNRADYLIVSSNRAYDAMPRLPLRYPLTVKYYQALFDCQEQLIYKCAYPAQPPLRSSLGFDLVAVFESDPTLGSFSFSDQTAEEAFTVYDHPKVFIFKKSASFSIERAAALLNSVDLSQVIPQTPAQYTAMPGGLLLPPDRLTAQTEGGAWHEMFDPFSMRNWYQPLGVLAWYALLFLFGWVAFPLVFAAMPGLVDRGYPLSRLIGLLLVAWLAWLFASFKILPFTQLTIGLAAFLLVCVGGFYAFRQGSQIEAFVNNQWRYILLVEGITLALFLLFLFIRWNNPDLWHPWLGGEKPQDFTFFNAVLKTVYFPPYHPWFSGHYINYYYYGYVIYAVPTKLLSIIPSIAYNLILPTMFSIVGAGVFSVTYNIAASSDASVIFTWPGRRTAVAAGLLAIVLMLLLGNLAEVRLLWKYLPDVSDSPPASNSDVDHTLAAASGAWRVITGQTQLPGDKGRWYFAASRAILYDKPESPITEFPLFSFLYADLHPHIAGMALIFAALGWTLSTLLAAKRGCDPQPASDSPPRPWLTTEAVALWFTAGLTFGAMQPTHTWDFPVLLAQGAVAIAASSYITYRAISRAMVGRAVVQVGLLAGLSVVMYSPFRQWFATQYSSVEIWPGARTPLLDYFTAHGLFLFLLISVIVWETRRWLAGKQLVNKQWLLHTPLGVLLPQIRTPLIVSALGLVAVVIGAIALWVNDYESLVFVMPLLVWIAALLLRRDQPLDKRIWLVLVGSGLGLTAVVEVFVLRGDVGRNNTVFRLYLQAWSFFSVAGGIALTWLIPLVVREWPTRVRRGWLAGLGMLVAAAGTYTVLATYMKMTDRWPNVENPPHTLDGTAYMLGSAASGGSTGKAAAYDDEGHTLNLAYDYGAIRWMLSNISGTPVIVEGNSPLYHWGNRFAINTGLPAVVGWDWHLKQHNSVLPGELVDERLIAVRDFYNTTDIKEAITFLKRYNVQYIIVGEMERGRYSVEGVAKFIQMTKDGLLQLAFPTSGSPNEGTVIYKVKTGDGG